MDRCKNIQLTSRRTGSRRRRAISKAPSSLAANARFEAACFACQQAVEKALKAALIWIAGDRPRTHEIGTLVDELAARCDGAREALGDVEALDPYYTTTRYPDAVGGAVPGSKFYVTETQLALDRARRAVAFVRNVFHDR